MNIYVGNIAQGTTEDELKAAFAAFGDIDKVALIKDKISGESRGFGFVEMPSKEQAEAAIAGLNDKDLKGQLLKVTEARPKKKSFGGNSAGRSRFGGEKRSFGGGESRYGGNKDRDSRKGRGSFNSW